MSKLKIGVLVALVSSVLLNVWLMTRPKPTPETVTIEKIVHVDRVVVEEREVVKTVTKPDGTKIVTETKTNTKETVKKETKTDTKVLASTQTKYSLGLGVSIDPFNPHERIYHFEAGKRLWNSQVWLTVGVNSRKEFLLGLRVEF